MGIIESIGDKLGLKGGGDKMQYLLVGALALVIIIAIVVIITSVIDTKKNPAMKDMHYWDLATQNEIILKPEDFKGSEVGPGMGPGMMGMGLMVNPKTGERTLLRMDLCPSCEKWFRPEIYRDVTLDDFDENGMLIGEEMESRMMSPGQTKTCPHCGVDIIQFYRDKRKKK